MTRAIIKTINKTISWPFAAFPNGSSIFFIIKKTHYFICQATHCADYRFLDRFFLSSCNITSPSSASVRLCILTDKVYFY